MTTLGSHEDTFVLKENPDPAEIQAAVQAVLNSAEFVRNPSSSKFLRFAVDETLAGRGDRLKAFTIATLALGRSASFDPQANSIVRVQALRLRELLVNYYAGPGASDPLQIVLPRGAYQPRFVRAPAPVANMSAIAPPAVASVAPGRRRWGWIGLAALFVCAAIAAAGYAAIHNSPAPLPFAIEPMEEGPVVTIATPEIVGAAQDDSNLPGRLIPSIESGLSAFDFFSVRRGDAVGSGVDYSLASRFVPMAGGKYQVYLRLLREPTGDVLWSHEYADVDPHDRQALMNLSRTVVGTVGDVGGGVIFSDLRARLFPPGQKLEGYRCILAGATYIRERSDELRAATRACLEGEISAHPNDFRAMTALSFILVVGYLNATPQSEGIADLRRALQLSRRAYELAPQRASTQAALFFSRFYDKRFDEAFQLAREAISISPESNLLMSRIARAYISRERYGEGLALMAPIEASGSGMAASAWATLALAAMMRGDMQGAYNYSMHPAAAFTPFGLVMRIISCHAHDDLVCATMASEDLRKNFAGFAADIPGALERQCFTDRIIAAVLNGLAQAGVSASPSR